MKAIIDGKRYDTETADLIHAWDNGHYGGDFRSRSKTLYHTHAGRWFIFHEGGPMTDMASAHGKSVGWGSSIEPVTPEDAFAFLTSHGGEDAAERHFAFRLIDA